MARGLIAFVLLAFAGFALADEPKKNPFTGGTPSKTPDKEPTEKPDTSVKVAHIKLTGELDEGPTPGESLFGSPKETLAIKLDRIRKAANDDRVKALYVELGGLSGGFGKINELRTAIYNFKAKGKKVFAYAEELGTKDYLVALACDAIAVPESGMLELHGLRAEVTFYKNTLELLKVKADVLKMGDYKSAVEPYLSDKMSAANREQIQSMLDDNFDNEIVMPMVIGRPKQKWNAGEVSAIIDQGPFTANKAGKLGLIDSVIYADQFEATFAKALEVKDTQIVRDYGKAKSKEPDFSNPFALLDAFSPKKPKESKEPKIAIIYAVGAIESGKGGSNPLPLIGGDSVGSDTLVAAIKEADANPTVKAIVLRIDSPGGSSLASDMMWRALKQCKKPVVASMGDVAASGGYYIASAGKVIYAEPGTITGSIGVFGMKLVTGGLEEMAGMKTEVVARGKNSGVNSRTFPWSESEKAAMTEFIEEVYDQFLTKALEGRVGAGKKMTKDDLKKLAGGRVWTGRQAKANGLVDELGTLDDVIGAAKKFAGIDPKTNMEIITFPKSASFLDQLMEGDFKMPFGSILDVRLIPGGEKALKMVAPLRTHRDPAKVMMPFVLEWK